MKQRHKSLKIGSIILVYFFCLFFISGCKHSSNLSTTNLKTQEENQEENFKKKYDHELEVFLKDEKESLAKEDRIEGEILFISQYTDQSKKQVEKVLRKDRKQGNSLREKAAIEHYIMRSGLSKEVQRTLSFEEKKTLYYQFTNMTDVVESKEKELREIAERSKISEEELSTMPTGEKYILLKRFNEVPDKDDKNRKLILKYVDEEELDKILEEKGYTKEEIKNLSVELKYLKAREDLSKNKRIPSDR